MPDLKISQLPVATTPLAGTELVPIVQGGVTDRTTVAAFLSAGLPVSATTLSASGAVTLSGGTANGVLYLNGSKVATSGSALTFDGTNGLAFGAGGTGNTVALLTLKGSSGATGGSAITGTRNNAGSWFIGDTQTALGSDSGLIYYNYVSGDPWIWYDGGASSERMRLTSTGLGIGTSSPGAKLDVNGEARASNFSSPTFSINSNPTSGVSTSQSQIRFKTTGADFYVGTEGSVGGVFFPGSTAYAAVLYNASSTPMQFYTAGTLRATLDSSGNLGLGVVPSASSLASFQSTYGIFIGNSEAHINKNAYYNAGWKYVATAAAARFSVGESDPFRWFTAPSGTAGNAISFTQAMTLDASGNLLVGTTSSSGLGRVEVVGGSGIRINEDASGTKVLSLRSDFAGSGPAINVTSSHPLLFLTANTERARITSTGNVVAGGSVALATTATDGFLYVPTCAGTPTGTPTAITGMAPIVVDTTNNKMYFYSGGAWRDAGP